MPEQLDAGAPPFVPSARTVILSGHGAILDDWAVGRYATWLRDTGAANDPHLDRVPRTTTVPPGVSVTVWAKDEVRRAFPDDRKRNDVPSYRTLHEMDDDVGVLIDAADFAGARRLLHDKEENRDKPRTFVAGEQVPNLLLSWSADRGGRPSNPAVRLYRVFKDQAITLRRVLPHLVPLAGPTIDVHWAACTQPLWADRVNNLANFAPSKRPSFGTRELGTIWARADDDARRWTEVLAQVSGESEAFERMRRQLAGTA